MYPLEEIEAIARKSIMGISFGKQPEGLYRPLEYMLSIGGKRIRPCLCLATYNLFSDNFSNDILYPAMALEIFHSFTLIHDDIMDEADTRRGQETVHKKWGNNCAILSGDVMSIFAYKYLAGYTGNRWQEVFSLFSDTAAQVCEGQQYDMDFESLPNITMDDYTMMIGLKTAVLIACSAKMGALIANAPEKVADALYQYGYLIGIAFQICDDYLDTFGNPAFFGKKIGGDIRNNKKTWLLVECFRLVKGEDNARLNYLMSLGDDKAQEKVDGIRQLYIKLGIKEKAQSEIERYHSLAIDAISNVGLSDEQIGQLKAFSQKLIHREG